MTRDNDDVIDTLNELIETCKDGEEGFRTCAETVEDSELKSLFQNRAQSCRQACTELQEEVRQLGGTADEHGSMTATLHRGWINLKSAIAGNEEKAILAECEHGEEQAVNDYRDALDEDLPPEVRLLVERQYQGAKRNYDLVRTLARQRGVVQA